MVVKSFSFYGDESGSHGEGSFVLSGYLGSDEVWSGFEDQWYKILHDPSIGGHEIDYFHMRECFKLEDQFSTFDRRQADKKLYALVDVLCPLLRSRQLVEFTSIIDWAMYRRTISDPIKDTFHNPYLLTFGAILMESTKYLRDVLKINEPAYFFLDDQIARVEQSVAAQFVHAQATLPPDLAGLIRGFGFQSDEHCDPLQAADLIAWQRHRRELNLSEDGKGRVEYKRLHNAASGAGLLMRYREDGLTAFVRRTEAALREKGLL